MYKYEMTSEYVYKKCDMCETKILTDAENTLLICMKCELEEKGKTGYKLEIDNREKYLIDCIGNRVDFKTSNLDIGDIIIWYNGSPIIVFERKSLTDHAASINGERYRNQKIRLKTLDCMVIYLIEGAEDKTVDMDSLIGSWVGITLRDNLRVLRTFNLEETANIVLKFFRRAQEFKFGTGEAQKSLTLNPENEYLTTVKLSKKANITPINILILQLAQIPGISVKMAEKIHEQYSTMNDLINYYNSLDEQLRPNALKNCGLGKVRSEKIYQYLFGLNNTLH